MYGPSTSVIRPRWTRRDCCAWLAFFRETDEGWKVCLICDAASHNNSTQPQMRSVRRSPPKERSDIPPRVTPGRIGHPTWDADNLKSGK